VEACVCAITVRWASLQLAQCTRLQAQALLTAEQQLNMYLWPHMSDGTSTVCVCVCVCVHVHFCKCMQILVAVAMQNAIDQGNFWRPIADRTRDRGQRVFVQLDSAMDAIMRVRLQRAF
jgi:hypothetical protein